MSSHRYDLVIDGYNLMHATGHVPRHSHPGEWQKSRERFLLWVWKRIPTNLRSRTILVFDAGETDNRYLGLSSFHELRLLYSPQGLEADDVIEDLIASHSAPKRLQIVSSDHRLHKAARARKATCIDSEVFIDTIARTVRRQREAQRRREADAKPEAELPDEVDAWLQIFADVQPLADKERLKADRAKTARSKTTQFKTRSSDRPAATESPIPSDRPETPSATPSRVNGSPSEKATSKVRRSERVTDETKPPELVLPADELAFWEQRLKELLEPLAAEERLPGLNRQEFSARQRRR